MSTACKKCTQYSPITPQLASFLSPLVFYSSNHHSCISAWHYYSSLAHVAVIFKVQLLFLSAYLFHSTIPCLILLYQFHLLPTTIHLSSAWPFSSIYPISSFCCHSYFCTTSPSIQFPHPFPRNVPLLLCCFFISSLSYPHAPTRSSFPHRSIGGQVLETDLQK